MSEIFRYLIQLALFTVLAFGMHFGFQYVFEQSDYWKTAHYNLVQIYFVEMMLSVVLVIGVVVAKKTTPGNLGFAFLGLITLKAVVSYLFIAPVLDQETQDTVLKHNFLIIFLIYLAFDVYVTYQLLNPNEERNKNTIKKVS